MTVFGYMYCAGHPAFVFQVVGQSRDDALTIVPGGKPSSRLVTNNTLIESLCDFSAVANVFSVLLDDVHGRFFYIVWTVSRYFSILIVRVVVVPQSSQV
jgi:hypothetical protein